MRLILGLGEHPPELPRTRQRTNQQMRVVTPRRHTKLIPVPLDLLCGAGEYAASCPTTQRYGWSRGCDRLTESAYSRPSAMVDASSFWSSVTGGSDGDARTTGAVGDC